MSAAHEQEHIPIEELRRKVSWIALLICTIVLPIASLITFALFLMESFRTIGI